MKRSDLKDVLDMFDSFASEHPDGHQKKKMNRYFVSGSRLCFAFEKNDGRAHIVDDVPAHIWCPMKVAAYVEGVEKIPYPASRLWEEKTRQVKNYILVIPVLKRLKSFVILI